MNAWFMEVKNIDQFDVIYMQFHLEVEDVTYDSAILTTALEGEVTKNKK